MAHDDEFEPRLGKIRGSSGKQARTYLQRVLQSAALSGCEFACNNDPLRGDFRVQNRPL